MKNGVMHLLAALLLASVLIGASPAPKDAILRVHASIVFTAHGLSVDDTDFVVASAGATRSIFGYTNTSANPGGGQVVTTFFRGTPTRRAVANLQTAIAALNLPGTPSACSLDSSSFTTGTYEVTLYNGTAGSEQLIAVTFDHSAPPAAQCPSSVDGLLQLLNDFFGNNAHPIP